MRASPAPGPALVVALVACFSGCVLVGYDPHNAASPGSDRTKQNGHGGAGGNAGQGDEPTLEGGVGMQMDASLGVGDSGRTMETAAEGGMDAGLDSGRPARDGGADSGVEGGADCSFDAISLCLADSLRCVGGTVQPVCNGDPGTEGCACKVSAPACADALSCADERCVPTPMAHWDMDGDGVDAVGGFHGTARSGAYFGQAQGAHSLVLDGNNDYLLIDAFADSFKSVLADFTLIMRVRPDSYIDGRESVLFSLGDDGDSSSANAMRLHVQGGELRLKTETGLGIDHVVSLGPAPPPLQWTTVAVAVQEDWVAVFTASGCDRRMQFVAVETQAGTMQVGGWAWNAISFDGLIDDVKVYDRALGGTEIQSIAAP